MCGKAKPLISRGLYNKPPAVLVPTNGLATKNEVVMATRWKPLQRSEIAGRRYTKGTGEGLPLYH